MSAVIEGRSHRPSANKPSSGTLSWLDRYFGITKFGSNFQTEVRAGVVTWLAMCYIVVVNPSILSGVNDSAGHMLAFGQVETMTALVAGVMTLAMGIVGKAPLGLAAGLGINSFVAYSLVGGPAHLTWPEAMGVVVSEGIVMAVCSYVKNIRGRVLDAIPKDLKAAISVGIGLFIGVIGLVNAGVVVKGNGTLVGLVAQYRGWPLMIFAFGLLITSAFVARKMRGALLYGIILTTALATVVNALNNNKVFTDGSAHIPTTFAAPSFHLIGAFSFNFWNVLGVSTAIAIVLSVMLSDFFDNTGTTYGIMASAGRLDKEGKLPNARTLLTIDGFAAVVGGICSQSSGTTFVESAAGVEAGGRTGLTAVVTGVLFLACIFLAPIAGIVPSVATAPVLVIVAYYMLKKVKDIDLQNARTGIPALLTMIMMPLTYSITDGVGIGMVTYVVISVLSGNRKDIHPALYVVACVFGWYFWRGFVA
ncbi:MAG TPA: NCS2 family permease [Candidatus Saccharimonadales bacterium]|nr:NCS2 family permease [Candidatus Saccharimonadales bacterium]